MAGHERLAAAHGPTTRRRCRAWLSGTAAILAAASPGLNGCMELPPDMFHATEARPAAPRYARRRSQRARDDSAVRVPLPGGDAVRVRPHYDGRDPSQNPDAVIGEMMHHYNQWP